jgi:hypothetical protein
MVTVEMAGLPSVAFVALVNITLNVLFDSFTPSSATSTLKVLTDSPGAKVITPEIAL